MRGKLLENSKKTCIKRMWIRFSIEFGKVSYFLLSQLPEIRINTNNVRLMTLNKSWYSEGIVSANRIMHCRQIEKGFLENIRIEVLLGDKVCFNGSFWMSWFVENILLEYGVVNEIQIDFNSVSLLLFKIWILTRMNNKL